MEDIRRRLGTKQSQLRKKQGEPQRAESGRPSLLWSGVFKKAWHEIDGCGPWESWFALGNETLGNAEGKGVNLKYLDPCGLPHGIVCLSLRCTTDKEVD
jgi:hypothetical protein